jgi:hypothetical protein
VSSRCTLASTFGTRRQALALIGAGPASLAALRRLPVRAQESPGLESVCSGRLFPADNICNTPVVDLPVDPNSAAYVAAIGPEEGLHPDFGSGLNEGVPLGILYTTVDDSQPLVPVTFDYADESDPGPYPIPPDASIEGGPEGDGGRHVLVVDVDHCILYELFAAEPQTDGSWHAGPGAIFDLARMRSGPPQARSVVLPLGVAGDSSLTW